MKESLQHLKVIAVGKSDTLHQICTRKKHSKVHQYTRTMFLSDEGTVQLDSSLRIGDVLELHSNSLDALHRSIHSASGPEGYIISEEARSYFNDPFTGSNQDLLISNVFSKLLGRLETRKRIENWLRQLHVLRYSRIRRVLRDDDAQVAQELVAVFASNSYKTDISSLTNEQAIQIMNLIDTILIQGFSTNFPIENYDTFIHTAQQCLIRLSEASGHFPDALVLQNVELVTSTPVTEGGFADVYRGRHTNYKGHTAEVALKVLKLRTTSYFSLTTEEIQGREKKFYKEALTWQYLDHENITVFYGIDRNTFPGKQAMVSQWMRHGTILDYMKKNSPFSQHAISCLSDIAAGLEYLHSHNVVHGDLCGRNILIDKRGRACLTDFGLTSFIESDTALKSTRRDGSPNWTAPELFEPEQFNLPFQRTAASDVYAYACVCYEIWTGGSPPFHNLWPETAVMLKVIAGARPGQPNDILGELMPNELWNIIQLCWTMQPQERLDSKVLSATIKDLHRQNLTADLIPSRASSSASGSMNDLNGDVQPNSDSSSSESEINSDLEADAESESIPMIRQSPAPPPPLPRRLKGKLRQVSIRDYVTFGPIKWGADPEGEFLAIIEEMYRNDSVKRGAMDEPDSLKKNNPKYVKLVFGSLAQANNFAMTWAVHRYQPYKRVKATLYPAV
ncbi:kinase-like protein [Gymnopus androsaceus JB14]|uniref:Kinase-like protein n=1 Tax=Gymnopus androsaceus JB14 TaxID=1447944 RepID=A0A6A4HZC6_9AGAR|nr:kinase-like protein [Gymnopus androsaceus JB14]